MNAIAAPTTEDPLASAASPAKPPTLADPLPIATGLLGLQLVVYVARWISVTPHSLAESALTAANSYALLIAGVAQAGAGVLSLVRGNAYVGYVATTFGLWLLGFYLLATDHGADPDSFAGYIAALVIPLVLLMVPAVARRRWAFIVAFGAILVMLVVDAVAFHLLHEAKASKSLPDIATAVTLLRTSAWAAGVAAVCLFWLTARGIFEATGLAQPAEHIS